MHLETPEPADVDAQVARGWALIRDVPWLATAPMRCGADAKVSQLTRHVQAKLSAAEKAPRAS